MPPKIKNEKNTRKIAGELRRTQTVSTFGGGSIVDFPRLSGIMAGIDSWIVTNLPEEARIHEHNLEKMLGKEYFNQVSSPENPDGRIFGLPVYRFPLMHYCPNCHELDLYYKINKSVDNKSEYNSALYCQNCGSALIPSRFVVSCLNGHLDDFPYVWWAHRKKGLCDNPQLFLEYKGSTGGLDSIHIYCKSCEAEETMEGCMNKDALRGLKCRGTMPWLIDGEKKGHWYTDPENCTAQLRTVQRSASNVYYPVNQSALTIPPWSSKAQKVFSKFTQILQDIFDEDDITDRDRRLSKHFEQNAREYGCTKEMFLKEVLKTYVQGEDDMEVTEQSLMIDEYKAFCQQDVNEAYFKTESTEVPEAFKNLIFQIKLVKRLREVMVLQGFRRILPTYEADEEVRKENGIFERKFAPLSKQPLNWLPAIELFGEGIFIQFNEESLEQWEQRTNQRYKKMTDRLTHSWIQNDMFVAGAPRYVFLHTFAHLLIRQLTAQCGYSTASLKEKVYSTYFGSGEKMCGILIYTAASDSDGSLGGLVREGEGNRLETTIHTLLEGASWCSNDPICIESKSQGYKALNYAACHACTLLPETSCENSNCLLDRASVVGLPDDKDVAFFKDFL